MSLTVDHLTYTLDVIPDEFDPTPRLWEIFKMGAKCEASYAYAARQTLYTYYQAKGCVYKSHHAPVKK